MNTIIYSLQINKHYDSRIFCNSMNRFALHSKLSLIGFFLFSSVLFNFASSQHYAFRQSTWFRQSDSLAISEIQNVYSMNVDGKCVINNCNPNSLLRIILVTSNGDEKLIAEFNRFNCGKDTIQIINENLEAYFDTPVSAAKLKVIAIDASFFIESINFNSQQSYSKSDVYETKKRKKLERIKNINDYLEKNGMLWRAGETYFSKLSYSELKQQLYGGCDTVFLHGYEYYNSGIFSSLNVPTSIANRNNTSSLVKNFSWTRRHGKNWNTPVKDQTFPVQPSSVGNGGCWAFAPIALAECYANIYYNQQINLDLSEQDIISCSGGGSCSNGGSPYIATNYITEEGVVSELCFPFSNTDAPCSEKCNDSPIFSGSNILWTYRLMEDSIKSLLINKGPVSVSVDNLVNTHHAILLVGYGTIVAGANYCLFTENQNSTPIVVPNGSPYIGKTYWICKNSYGNNHGVSGYDYFIFDTISRMSNYISLYGTPVVSGYSDNDVVCEDLDGDGYYNWGIGQKPSHCPSCPDLPDGNDYNPNIGGMDRMGHSIYLADSTQAPYIDGSDAIGCNGKYVVVNLPEDMNITWSIASDMSSIQTPVSIVGPSTEAMVKVRQTGLPIFGETSNRASYVTLVADFSDNSTSFQLSKTIQVFGDVHPRFNTNNMVAMRIGTSKTITELNCTNIPSQYIRWDLDVPGIGRYTQFGHSVTVCPTLVGTISITVTNLLSCSNTQGSFSYSFIVINPHFSIVANPVDEILSIELSGCRDSGHDLMLDITDSMGNTMYMENIDGEYMSINTSMYKPGVYTIRLLCDKQCIQTDKFIKK